MDAANSAALTEFINHSISRMDQQQENISTTGRAVQALASVSSAAKTNYAFREDWLRFELKSDEGELLDNDDVLSLISSDPAASALLAGSPREQEMAFEEEAGEPAETSKPPCPTYAELLEVMERASGRLQLPWERVKKGAARGRLAKRFLSGHNKAAPVSLPFLPDLHVEIEKAWKNPYSAHIHLHQRANFADVEGLSQHGPSTSPPANTVTKMEPPSLNNSEHAEQGPSIVHVSRAESRGPSLIILLTVDGVPVNAVIDTGAEATIMSEETYSKLPTKSSSGLKNVCLRNAETGREMSAKGGVKVEFRIGTKVLEWTVCIAPIQDALLLGLDFLKAADFTIHASDKVFMGSKLIPAYISEGKGPDYAISRVMLESDVTVPPECECLVWGVIDDPKPELPAVLEPVSLADGVSSGSIMINMEQRIPVRPRNVTASSRPLSRGVCLGVLIEAYPDAQEEGKRAYSVPVDSQLHEKGGDSVLQDPDRRELDSLPCKGCPFCRKLHHQWARFEEDVDDVIPLAVRCTHSLNCQNEVSCTNTPSLVNEAGDNNPGPLSNWLQPLSLESLRKEQLADPDHSVLHKWMVNRSLPAKEEVMMQSPAVRKYWLCWSQVEMQDGVLYYRWDDVTGGMSSLNLLVPVSLKNEVLQACHNPAQAGHVEEEKTLTRLRRRYHWYNVGSDAHDIWLRTAEVTRGAKGTSEFVQELQAILQQAHQVARQNLHSAQTRQKKVYDLRAREKSYQVGDLVLVRVSSRKKGYSPNTPAQRKTPEFQ
ncbi:hypothetical protein DPX16_21551 [Anabarilius grahami]|uniref:Gypsy retrotransposon integrase-like protein 1 n=1 Tax=Anabarilius grahami TaxID=495550 RepID=A0A3N0XUQ9_ANAGA|nr:hypothetical protein DPX16_21551 [Anabarilius grahami]